MYVVGVALDYCVGFTSLDAISLGYKTTVVRARSDLSGGSHVSAVVSQPENLKTKTLTATPWAVGWRLCFCAIVTNSFFCVCVSRPPSHPVSISPFSRSRARADQVLDAARGVNADSINTMLGNLKAAGAQFVPSSALLPPSA